MVTTTTILLVASGLLFLIGLGLGWILAASSNGTRKKNLRTAIAIAITAIWMIAMIADILVAGYTISPLVHAIMGAIVGYFFTDDGLNLNIGSNNK